MIITAVLGLVPVAVLAIRVRFNWVYFLVGMSLLVLTLIVQPFLMMPIAGLATCCLILAAVLAGLIAGFLQEGLKAAVLKGPGRDGGLWLGAGFGTAEVLLVLLQQWVLKSAAPWPLILLPGVERMLSTWFHIVTAGIIAAAWVSGKVLVAYLGMAAAHSAVDAWAAYIQFTRSFTSTELVLGLYAFTAAVNTLLTILLILWGAGRDQEMG